LTSPTSNESMAWYASSTRILVMHVPRRTSQLGSRRSVDRTWCLILLWMFIFEHFKSEHSRITVPSWHGFNLSDRLEHSHSRGHIGVEGGVNANKVFDFVLGQTFKPERFSFTASLWCSIDTLGRHRHGSISNHGCARDMAIWQLWYGT
jgi:hypothetical protein